MTLRRFHPQSLKARLTLLTVLITFFAMVLLALYARSLLQQELLRFTGEQQRSALALLSAEVNHNLQDRMTVLTTVATEITHAALEDQHAGQAFLIEQAFLAGLFNGGVMLWNPKGQLLADLSFKPWGGVTQPLGPQELARVLTEGQSIIGRVHRDARLQVGVFAMAVPIRNDQGRIVGAIGGAIRLDQLSFLSTLTAHTYGQTGHFFLMDARQRLIFASSDPTRVMERLPEAGISPWIDRFMQGFEGTARVVNPHGVEVLVSIKQIPLANWYASVTLSPDDAFSVLTAMQARARWAALMLMILLAALFWWLLRRQLEPMTLAVKTLAGFVYQNQPPQALPVTRADEVGELVGGFNRLLEILAQQQQKLKDSEGFKQAVLNSVTTEMAVLDQDGVILTVNEAWQRNSIESTLKHRTEGARDRPHEAVQGAGPSLGVGTNYLAACRDIVAGPEAREDLSAVNGMRAVLRGDLPHFFMEFPVRHGWLSMSVTPMMAAGQRGAVVSIEDISQRVKSQKQMHEMAFYDPLTHLPNRRLVMDRLAQQLTRARRTHCSLALLFIDLDNFKPINDELGHDVGDWLLQAAAQRIQGCLRASDTAARLGGDEFVVLLPDLASSEAALNVAEKIRLALAQEFVSEQGVGLKISSSIGVALYPEHGQTEKDLLRIGDEAMYLAKKGGRNAVVSGVPKPSVLTEATGAQAEPDNALQPALVHLRWSSAFAIGHPLIDPEHEALFGLANALLDCAAERLKEPLAFDAAFTALLTFCEQHFAHEEAILRADEDPDLPRHALAHQTLLEHARALFADASAAPQDAKAAAGLVMFLVSELVAGHILQEDQAFLAVPKE